MKSNILELFLLNSKKYSKKTSIVENGNSLSYLNLLIKVKQIAFQIHTHVNSTHPRVLLLLDKGSDAYASMFASFMVGGFYCPVNISTPEAKLNSIINQFDPDIILYKKNLLFKKKKIKINRKFIDISNLNCETFNTIKKQHKLAYVIFTSGTTGDPKGVMINKTSLMNYVLWAQKYMNIKITDRWSQYPNIGFDLSVLDIYACLCSGATLFPLIDERDILFPTRFIKKNKLTIWNSVPSAVDVMSSDNWWKKSNIKSLRLLSFCGEPLFETHLKKIFKIHPNVKVQNTYGPTEATVSCTAITLTKKNYLKKIYKSVSLGTSITNMNISLFKPRKNVGEIIISGIQLSPGYWRNKSLTNKFFKKKFINKKKILFYRTGDLGKFKNGKVYFVGRVDNQIKIKGHRIELESIDYIISKINKSPVCTVFVNKKLYCFLEKGKINNTDILKKKLLLHLASYEIPKYFYYNYKLPRNQNNKIDRNQLIKFLKL